MPTLGRSGSQPKGYVVAVIAAFFLSTTAIFIRYLTLGFGVPALVLALWRDVFVVVTLIPALAMARPRLLRVPVRLLPYLAVYGLVLALFNSLWTLSVALNGAAVATILVYSSGAFTASAGAALPEGEAGLGQARGRSHEPLRLRPGRGPPRPGLMEWRSGRRAHRRRGGLSYALYSLFGRSAADRGLDPWTPLVYIFAFAALFLFAVNCVPGELRSPAPRGACASGLARRLVEGLARPLPPRRRCPQWAASVSTT